MSLYTSTIIELTKCTTEEAPMVEGYMRLSFGTLDGLTRARFRKEAQASLKEVRQNPELAKSNAQSYGLIPK